MAQITLINGVAETHLDPADRGLAYGDGLFETILTCKGKLLYWCEHLTRLLSGCARLSLQAEALLATLESDWAYLYANYPTVLQGYGILKVTVTRGIGQRGYRYDDSTQPTRIMTWSPYVKDHIKPKDGIKAYLCRTRLGKNPVLAGIKHLNRLEQVLARAEWSDPDIAEGVVCDVDGALAEGTMSNLFWVVRGVLMTPSLHHCGVHGIMRQRLLCLAEEIGLPVQQVELPATALEQADELFVANSVIGIWPIVQLVERNYPIGPVTRQLQALTKKDGM